MQKWPVRRGTPLCRKSSLPVMPMITGQRVIDTMFPIAKGRNGVRARDLSAAEKPWFSISLPSGADVDIVVYIGCGERGNEMTDVLSEFPELQDPQNRVFADEAHRADCQHLGYAGGCARGFHLYGHHHCGILPRYGLFGGGHGRLHFPLGRSAARNVRPFGRNAR